LEAAAGARGAIRSAFYRFLPIYEQRWVKTSLRLCLPDQARRIICFHPYGHADMQNSNRISSGSAIIEMSRILAGGWLARKWR